MTPFDPVAVLAMLKAFYPIASAAALLLAWTERPEYFAGGVIVSTGRDKIKLPDDRVFDLIYDVDGVAGGPLWQAIEVGPGGETDPYALEPGPLTVLIDRVVIPPPMVTAFRESAGPYLGDMVSDERAIDGRRGELAAAANPAEMHGLFDTDVSDGDRELHHQLWVIGELDPSDIATRTTDRGPVINDARNDYPDPNAEPGDITVSTQPRRDPPIEGSGETGPWYQQ